MALEDIFRALEEQAQKECDDVLASAREQAEMIGEDAVEQAESLTAAKIADAEKATRLEATQSVNATRLEGKKRVATMKGDAVDAAFDEAMSALSSKRSDADYPAVFRALTEEALQGVEADDIVALVDPADADLARSVLAELGVVAEVETELSTTGGLVIAVRGGRIKRRNTFEDRLQKVKQAAQADVAEILFS